MQQQSQLHSALLRCSFFFGPLSLQIYSLVVTPFSPCHFMFFFSFCTLHSAYSISLSFSLCVPLAQLCHSLALSVIFLFLTYKHPASLSSVPLCLTQIHFCILQCFIYTLPPLLLSVGSLCWGRHSKEPACHKSYTLGRGVAKDLCTN